MSKRGLTNQNNVLYSKLGNELRDFILDKINKDPNSLESEMLTDIIQALDAGEDVYDKIAQLFSKPFMQKWIELSIKYDDELKPDEE